MMVLTMLSISLAYNVHVVDKSGAPIQDAYVELIPKKEPATVQPKDKVIIDQVDKEFVPMVSAVPVGTTVFFPNSDNIQHQIYSFSSAKNFDLPLYGSNDVNSIVFDNVGVVSMGCNIHDWMLAYVYIYESVYFKSTNSEGLAIFDDIPDAEYTLRVWSPRLRSPKNTIEVDIVVNKDNSSSKQVLNVRKSVRKPARIEDKEY
ncbi:MAG: methylamine utilization protein [Proteobacteria bacterium]|nr:methylamine utilization protein [Pseudomonadota bacterium]